MKESPISIRKLKIDNKRKLYSPKRKQNTRTVSKLKNRDDSTNDSISRSIWELWGVKLKKRIDENLDLSFDENPDEN